LDRESFGRVTADGVETVWRPWQFHATATTRKTARDLAREATRVSEVGRTITGICGWDEYSYTDSGDPLKRFGRRETLQFLGLDGRNPSSARRVQILTMNREQASTGAR
jgi:hypothetical protein